mgnify:FL=1
MDRQDDRSLQSFAYGGDAEYLEDLYARYEDNPSSVNGEWAAFFAGLADNKAIVEKNARGASWAKPN